MSTVTDSSAPLNRKAFFGMALTIATPAMLQNLISTLVSSADTIMLGYVSQEAMAASSLANQLVTVLSMAFYGLVAATSVMVAQYWGKKDTKTIERILGLGLRITLIVSLVFFVAAFFFPATVMKCFTNEEAIIREGVTYLRIVSFTYLMMGCSQIFVCVMRSMEKVVLPTVIYIVSLLTNVLLNATFIFGLFGAPKLGLVGVAIGTVVARAVELLICVIYSEFFSEIKIRMKAIFGKAGILLHDFLHLSLPSMANDVIWSLATTVYSMVMGRMGSDAVAANAVAVMAVNIGAVVCRGFAGATTIIVSKSLGANRIKEAKLYSARMIILTTFFGVLGFAVVLLIKPLMVSMYADKLTESALVLLSSMLLFRGIQLIGEAVNTCLICGCVRGGGDAKYGMFADMLFMWLVAVPLTLLAAFVFKLPAKWVYFVLCMDEFEKVIPFFIHYFKFNWLNNITRDESELTA